MLTIFSKAATAGLQEVVKQSPTLAINTLNGLFPLRSDLQWVLSLRDGTAMVLPRKTADLLPVIKNIESCSIVSTIHIGVGIVLDSTLDLNELPEIHLDLPFPEVTVPSLLVGTPHEEGLPPNWYWMYRVKGREGKPALVITDKDQSIMPSDPLHLMVKGYGPLELREVGVKRVNPMVFVQVKATIEAARKIAAETAMSGT